MATAKTPVVLYKYCAPERMNVLRNRLIRFTQRDDLNDIYEMRPSVIFDQERYNGAREEVAKVHQQLLQIPATTREEHQNQIDYALQQALVLSLSSDWNIISMWSHYAVSHRGMVIGFDRSDSLLATTTEEVQYTSCFPMMDDDFRVAIFHKSEQWQQEREWRSLRVLGKDVPDQTPHDGIHLFGFSPKAVAEVIIGHRMSDSDTRRIRRILKQPQYGHVRIFQAVPDEHAWAIERKELSPCR